MSEGPGHDLERQTAPAAAQADVRPSKLQGPLAAIAAAFLTVDFFTPAIMDARLPEILGVILFGMLPAQFGVLAVWAVVGPGRWLARQAATTALAALGWLAFGAGAAVSTHAPSDMSEVLFRFTALVPLVFLAVQLPLWIGRWLRGWRLVEAFAAAAADRRESRRFSMSDLLLMPALVGVPLALARFCAETAEEMAGSLIFAACLAPVSGFATLPCLLSAFRSRTAGGGFVAIAGYAFGLGLAFDAIGLAMAGAPAGFAALWAAPLWLLSLLASIHGSLALVRNAGYVLLPIPSSSSVTPESRHPA